MAKKYKQTDRTPLSVSEPAVAYRRTPTIDRVYDLTPAGEFAKGIMTGAIKP